MRFGPLKPSFINTYSLEFDGVDDYVDTGITTTGTNDVSISCWMNTTETFAYTVSRCAFGGLDFEEKIYTDLFYRNIEGFISGGFPVLRRLVDDSRWHQMVRCFVESHHRRRQISSQV